MKIVSVVFDYPTHSHKYSKMAKVWEYSIKKVMPDVTVELIKIDPPHWEVKKSYTSNTVKLDLWYKSLEATNENIIFMDCDMFVLGEMESAFDNDFDIGYTVKARIHKTSCRINGGIIFVKNTENAKAWMNELLKINEKMYYNEDFHNQWRCKYYGMNQSAMGYMSERYKGPAKVKEFSTLIYNACDCDWKNVKSNTKIVHIKGKLREYILKNKDHFHYSYIIKKWRQYHGAPIPVVKKRSKKTRRQRRRRAVMRIRRTK